MKVIIIEDEEFLANDLEKQLNLIDPTIHVSQKLTTVNDSIAWLSHNKCDLIFADIELTDGLSFDIFRSIDIQLPIIFITAYDQYAIKAFTLNSIGYLLKPFENIQLANAISKYKKFSITNKEIDTTLNILQNNNNSYLRRIIVSMGKTYKPVNINDIVCFIADDRYLFALLPDRKKYYYDSTLQNLEKLLNPSLFFRVNRKYLINKNFINELTSLTGSRIAVKLTIKNTEEIIVSYQKNNEFKQWIIN